MLNQQSCPSGGSGIADSALAHPVGSNGERVTYPHLYHRFGVQIGVSSETLSRVFAERARFARTGTYPIFSLGHLAHETGASYPYLREIVSRERDPYRSIAMPKRDGHSRPISAPEPILMSVQRWLLDHVLISLPMHEASYAYQRDKSIVDCASQHRGARWMVKMDLHDFFGTVQEESVYGVFRTLNYSKLVSFELARITTRAEGVRLPYRSADRAQISSYAVLGQGVLPQGGPTSGALANAVARRLDRFLQRLAIERGLVYTRYSDDLVFSGSEAFRRGEAESLVKQVHGLIRKSGFSAHHSKTKIVPPGARKVVLGLLVDDTVRLLPEQRRRIEVHLRGCELNGIARHAAHRRFDSVFGFIDHLDGLIAFALGVDPGRAIVWRGRLNQILESEGLPKIGGSS